MKLFFFVFAMSFFLCACNGQSSLKLQTGDIIFTGIEDHSLSSDLSQAIDGVTQTHLKTHFTHMGIVQVDNDSIFVIHAEPKYGVHRELVADFLTGRGEASVFRLNEEWMGSVDAAIDSAMALLGLPYDYVYMIGGDAHYCSGFIYTIFEPAGVFELEPMTFIDPATGDFHSVWVDHYKRLGIDIPEGEPGCNPNGMAASTELSFIGTMNSD
ncbi:YiiX/YebB-like N1pC/P60 family cysteine hydrolase [Natronoflexus pectinivorans]|uniref:Permuted papain-like amidase YaeF/Yiix C92 family enzyme n=1 Tax=Natronoflexus pectinivorans TaxID=682526 RepID=A0A4R2GJK9_9BACT|nr:YiiX/YebB-like N1pC/P60 family cysteine hydrolase [Natronoflexus pectinivorans]TCO08912.1 permuted papain-like amidase YaeF/Yiix C92 family enzyme [Natronoflexus pectinivorans]